MKHITHWLLWSLLGCFVHHVLGASIYERYLKEPKRLCVRSGSEIGRLYRYSEDKNRWEYDLLAQKNVLRFENNSWFIFEKVDIEQGILSSDSERKYCKSLYRYLTANKNNVSWAYLNSSLFNEYSTTLQLNNNNNNTSISDISWIFKLNETNPGNPAECREWTSGLSVTEDERDCWEFSTELGYYDLVMLGFSGFFTLIVIFTFIPVFKPCHKICRDEWYAASTLETYHEILKKRGIDPGARRTKKDRRPIGKMLLKHDMVIGKVNWHNTFWKDFLFLFKREHSFVSAFFGHKYDPFDPCERRLTLLGVAFCMVGFIALLTWVTGVLFRSNAIASEDKSVEQIRTYDDFGRVGWQGYTAITIIYAARLTMPTFVWYSLYIMGSCHCGGGCNCVDQISNKYIRSGIKKTGHCTMYLLLLLCFCIGVSGVGWLYLRLEAYPSVDRFAVYQVFLVFYINTLAWSWIFYEIPLLYFQFSTEWKRQAGIAPTKCEIICYKFINPQCCVSWICCCCICYYCCHRCNTHKRYKKTYKREKTRRKTQRAESMESAQAAVAGHIKTGSGATATFDVALQVAHHSAAKSSDGTLATLEASSPRSPTTPTEDKYARFDFETGTLTDFIQFKSLAKYPVDEMEHVIGNKNGPFACTWMDYRNLKEGRELFPRDIDSIIGTVGELERFRSFSASEGSEVRSAAGSTADIINTDDYTRSKDTNTTNLKNLSLSKSTDGHGNRLTYEKIKSISSPHTPNVHRSPITGPHSSQNYENTMEIIANSGSVISIASSVGNNDSENERGSVADSQSSSKNRNLPVVYSTITAEMNQRIANVAEKGLGKIGTVVGMEIEQMEHEPFSTEDVDI